MESKFRFGLLVTHPAGMLKHQQRQNVKISTLKISNVFSYGYIADFENAPDTISFNENLNILIGPNGSGKSNLIEIIQVIFFRHFNGIYESRYGLLERAETSNQKVIKGIVGKDNQIYIREHFETPNKPIRIRITISLDKGDLKNLQFIQTNWIELKRLAIKYCENSALLNGHHTFQNVAIAESSVIYDFNKIDRIVKGCLKSVHEDSENLQTFFYHYLCEFNQLQQLVDLANAYENKDWELMKNPFAMISSLRQYGGFASSFEFTPAVHQNRLQHKSSEITTSTKAYTSTDTVFYLFATGIGQEVLKKTNKEGNEAIIRNLQADESTIFYKISEALRVNLGFHLKIENYNQHQQRAEITIYEGDKRIQFDELSSGQKSIFYLLFTIQSYELENGLLLIDEPELHLHASMQKIYFKILQTVIQSNNLQIIVATHSGVFVDEVTINKTFRFAKHKSNSFIVSPPKITALQKDLLRILTYTNSARIFFADKVLLVEGDTDEYFFRFFLENHFLKNFPQNRNLEILCINGKSNYIRWKDFLNAFEIPCYFIGDFDNVNDFKLLSTTGTSFQELIKKTKDEVLGRIFKKTVMPKDSKDGQKLLQSLDSFIKADFAITAQSKEDMEALWQYLLERHALGQDYIVEYLNKNGNERILAELIQSIERKYSDNVFVLKKGDLEDYIGVQGAKDLDKVIKFCNNDFEGWIANVQSNQVNEPKLSELTKIFQRIFE